MVIAMLIGPLAHVKYTLDGKNYRYHVDWSRPGAVERFNAEEELWWKEQPDQWRGKFPGP